MSDETLPAFVSLNVGDEVAAREVEFTRGKLVRYAGASGDFNPIHYNDAFAKSVGLDGVIAHGMLTMGVGASVVEEWAGAGNVVDFQARFTRPIAGRRPRGRHGARDRGRGCPRPRREAGPHRRHRHGRRRQGARQGASARRLRVVPSSLARRDRRRRGFRFVRNRPAALVGIRQRLAARFDAERATATSPSLPRCDYGNCIKGEYGLRKDARRIFLDLRKGIVVRSRGPRWTHDLPHDGLHRGSQPDHSGQRAGQHGPLPRRRHRRGFRLRRHRDGNGADRGPCDDPDGRVGAIPDRHGSGTRHSTASWRTGSSAHGMLTWQEAMGLIVLEGAARPHPRAHEGASGVPARDPARDQEGDRGGHRPLPGVHRVLGCGHRARPGRRLRPGAFRVRPRWVHHDVAHRWCSSWVCSSRPSSWSRRSRERCSSRSSAPRCSASIIQVRSGRRAWGAQRARRSTG